MSRPDQQHPLPSERSEADVRRGRIDRRRERIRDEVRRNRAGGHRVPTWVLAALLGLILAGWLLLIITS
ncbi:hypothetical protein KOI35_13305 [Actinoplanes bogorensis]|uniref:Uncharacterized protein n=1 Tax=Paractinoplanes bogorensis TaxID=1610840 RepID=A0ABS5YP08_9ACTN|nr:hypothetical protein [Actinoplanes bogorensis]MBU2664474.1 hypothetical protein [Actinoplanes bogorensis]